jgi:hypothetical protein
VSPYKNPKNVCTSNIKWNRIKGRNGGIKRRERIKTRLKLSRENI